MPEGKLSVVLGPAQETLLITLYGRAVETRKRSGLIDDPRAVRANGPKRPFLPQTISSTRPRRVATVRHSATQAGSVGRMPVPARPNFAPVGGFHECIRENFF